MFRRSLKATMIATGLLLLCGLQLFDIGKNSAYSAITANESSKPTAPAIQKKLLNFIPELAVGAKIKHELTHFQTHPTTQEVFELEKGDSYTTAFAFDRNRYAYIGANISPARIIKFDMKEMKRVGAIDLPAGENRDETRVAALIAVDSETVIHASFTNPATFTKINGTTMKITGTLKGAVEAINDKHIRSMTYDGKYVYAANYSVPSKIIKFDPVTMKRVDVVTFHNMEISDVTAITIVGKYIVGVSGRDEDHHASIFRVSLENLHEKPDIITIPGFSRYHSIATDGKYIYAGTFTNPISVVKVDVTLPHLKWTASFTGMKDTEKGNFSIVYNGQDIVVGTWNLDATSDKLIKIDPVTMKRKNTRETPVKFPSDLMYLEPYIYTATDQPTGVVLRMKF